MLETGCSKSNYCLAGGREEFSAADTGGYTKARKLVEDTPLRGFFGYPKRARSRQAVFGKDVVIVLID